MRIDFDDLQFYRLLLNVCNQFGVDPSSSLDAEAFFKALLKKYEGELEVSSLTIWLENQVRNNFIALNERPKWIQNPEWPLVDGIPLIFAGQIDLSVSSSEPIARLFHDDTSLYVFISQKTAPVVIMQQY